MVGRPRGSTGHGPGRRRCRDPHHRGGTNRLRRPRAHRSQPGRPVTAAQNRRAAGAAALAVLTAAGCRTMLTPPAAKPSPPGADVLQEDAVGLLRGLSVAADTDPGGYDRNASTTHRAAPSPLGAAHEGECYAETPSIRLIFPTRAARFSLVAGSTLTRVPPTPSRPRSASTTSSPSKRRGVPVPLSGHRDGSSPSATTSREPFDRLPVGGGDPVGLQAARWFWGRMVMNTDAVFSRSTAGSGPRRRRRTGTFARCRSWAQLHLTLGYAPHTRSTRCPERTHTDDL